MVAGVFVYPHLFSTQKTNVSDLPTSDSPAIFLSRLASVLLAVATLPLWEGLFRHTDLSPSREEIVLSRCRATGSLIALFFKRSQRKMSYHPCPDEALSRNDARQQSVGDGGVFKPPTQILQRTKNCRGFIKVGPVRLDL